MCARPRASQRLAPLVALARHRVQDDRPNTYARAGRPTVTRTADCARPLGPGPLSHNSHCPTLDRPRPARVRLGCGANDHDRPRATTRARAGATQCPHGASAIPQPPMRHRHLASQVARELSRAGSERRANGLQCAGGVVQSRLHLGSTTWDRSWSSVFGPCAVTVTLRVGGLDMQQGPGLSQTLSPAVS